ncbi:MAG: polysaccharide deacetylase family protein [Chlamydiales bacterium]|nr:polysaccharide deacetylase family protein [Chlamydiales bacterium]
MLQILLYHQVHQKGKYSNDLETFSKHLDYINKHFTCTLPGEALDWKFKVCLSFDDATYDFYHSIFPLLKQKQMPALLAVPTAFIQDTASKSNNDRLAQLQSSKAPHEHLDNYCTWKEIQEMASSPLIEFASHTHSHIACDKNLENFEQEILLSKELIETHTGKEVKSFVYPFGKLDKQIHKSISKHYSYIFRIGNSLNFNWDQANKLYFRCNADNLENPKVPFSYKKYITYLLKLPVNYLKTLYF